MNYTILLTYMRDIDACLTEQHMDFFFSEDWKEAAHFCLKLTDVLFFIINDTNQTQTSQFYI